MRMFNADKVAHFMEWLKTPPDVPIESKAVTRSIRSAQTQVEQQNFEIRKDVLKYDDVLNRQRKVIYGERRRVLEGADLHEQIREMIDEVIEGYVTGATSEGFAEEWDLSQLWTALRALYHPTLTADEVVEEAGGEQSALSQEFLVETLRADAQQAYDRREEELTPEIMRELERRVVLSVLDRKWREHLYEMDYLREGIGLRAWAQRDPLVEYQREGYDMFGAMMEGIKEESVGNLFNLQVEVQENPIVEEAADGAVAIGPAPAGAHAKPGGPGGAHAKPAPDGNGQAAPSQPAPAQQQHGQPVAPVPGRGARPGQRRTAGRRARTSQPRGRRAGRGAGAAAPEAPGPAAVQRAVRGRPGPGGAARRPGLLGRPVQPGRPQRHVPVRLGPQIQALPRGPAQPVRQLTGLAARARAATPPRPGCTAICPGGSGGPARRAAGRCAPAVRPAP